MNSYLAVEPSYTSIPGRTPTMILKMDMSQGSPGQSGVTSITAVSMFTLCSLL